MAKTKVAPRLKKVVKLWPPLRGQRRDPGDQGDELRAELRNLLRSVERLKEGIDIMESIEQMEPHQISSRQYSWMRDWLAAANSCVRRLEKP